MAHVLIIDDDPNICLVFINLLKHMGHDTEVGHTLKEGLALSRSRDFDIILLDLELPDGNGLTLLPDLKKTASEPEVIIITGTGNARGAETAFKYEAWDYIQKPFRLDDVSLPINRALQYRREKKSQTPPMALVRSKIVGESDAVQKCLEEVARAAITDAAVLITGETGTGKELFAKAIHENSKRASHPFIVVDCGALPETLVESTLFGHEKGAFTGAQKKQEGLIIQAHGGTLMLDEVGDLPPAVQKSFLRTLQEKTVRSIGGKSEKPVDFRLVAATHLDLDQMVRERRFREDLLYRIQAIGIKLPPLRERGKDIEIIALNKIHEFSRRYGFGTKAVSPEFFKTLGTHPWPGNVRELMNVLEYALASAGEDPTLFPKHLPLAYRMARLCFDPVPEQRSWHGTAAVLNKGDKFPSLPEYRAWMEKEYLKLLLGKTKGDRKEAGRISGISQSRLYGLLNKYGLPRFGPS